MTYAKEDRKKNELTYAEVETRRNGMKLQDQEGRSDDKLFVEAQQIRYSDS